MIVEITTGNNGRLPFGNVKGKDRIIQNIQNILNTYKYEVAYNREFGISADVLDKDLETMKGIIIDDLYENISAYEPRAKLKSVDIKGIENDGTVIVAVQIEI